MNALSKLAEGSTSIAYLYENNNKKYVMCVPTKKTGICLNGCVMPDDMLRLRSLYPED